MRAVILGQKGGWHTESLAGALARRGIAAEALPITRLTARVAGAPSLQVAGTDLHEHDVVFVRAVPSGSLEQVVFRMDALRVLEDRGVRVVNSPRAIEHGVDKYYAAALLEDAGLSTPATVVCERFEDAMEAYEALGGDVVVKPLFGSEGRGIVRVSDADTAYRVFRALELGRYVFCVQVYVEHGNEDIRAFVIGDRVIAAMRRVGTHWKSNAAQGARGEALEADPQLAETSVRAASAVGAEHAGVDLLCTGDGRLVVVEVNTIPGWRALRAATGMDAALALVDHVLGAAR